MPKTVPATTLRNHLSDVIKEVNRKKKKFLLITNKGRPVSAIVNLDYFEDLLALASPNYIKSIQEAREDYKQGRVYTHQEVFGDL